MPGIEFLVDVLIAVAIGATLVARRRDRIQTGSVSIRSSIATAALVWLVGVSAGAMVVAAVMRERLPG